MAFLLDTHTFIWAMEGDPRLTASAKRILEDPAQIKIVSIISGWEMAIKVSSGKLSLPITLQEIFPGHLDKLRIAILPIQPRHLHRLLELPRHHGDPFDRLLAAQSLSEDFTLVDCDAAFDAYGVRRMW